MNGERTWEPGDSPVLPDADESGYPPDAVLLPVELGYDPVARTAEELDALFVDSEGFGEHA